MRKIVVLPALFLLAGCGSSDTRSPAGVLASGSYRGSIPPPGITAPDFRLPSVLSGRLVTMRQVRGRVVLTTFVDTRCREKCPIIVGEMAAGLRLLSSKERGQVTALALSVDPPVDRRRSVIRFLRQRGALGQLDYLVAPIREMRPVWKAYGILPAVDTGNADVHSADVRIFDRRGRWVSTLRVGVDLTPANLAHDLRKALAERNTR